MAIKVVFAVLVQMQQLRLCHAQVEKLKQEYAAQMSQQKQGNTLPPDMLAKEFAK